MQYPPYPHAPEAEWVDFEAVHLLDCPFHYFDTPYHATNTHDKRLAAIKQNIWYLAKLAEGGLISPARFHQWLRKLQGTNFNALYHGEEDLSTDSQINRVATIMQALGRVERVRQPMPRQIIRLQREVWAVVASFALRPEHAPARAAMRGLLSDNMEQLLEQVTKQMKGAQRRAEDERDERLPRANRQSSQAVRTLLDELAALRRGTGDRQARATWEGLRQAVLRHDFQHELVQQYACATKTLYREGTVVHMDEQGNVLPPDLWQMGERAWNLDSLYVVPAANPAIREAFNAADYPLAFATHSAWLFTPYCYQAILKGAVGEEAIRAVMEKKGVHLEEISDAIYELADLKVAGVPLYLDCKYYGPRTLDIFSLPETDPAWHAQLNDKAFLDAALRKVAALREHGEPTAKMVYLNLATRGDWQIAYWNARGEVVESWHEATTVVVPGVVDWDDPTQYTPEFIHVLKHI